MATSRVAEFSQINFNWLTDRFNLLILKMKQPFTVVIPLYNKEKYVRKTIESVLAQQHREFELIVVDDGSTDSSADIVKGMSDSRIRLIKKRNGGVSAARNTGIEAAQYEHIAFLDADDTWEANHLKKLAQLIEDFPEAGMHCMGYRFVEPNGEEKFPAWFETSKRGLVLRYFHCISKGDLLATASSVCIAKSIFSQIGMFPVGEALGEDQDMWARIALKWALALDPEPTVIYHRYSDEGRGCNLGSYQQELPYSRRLQQQLDSGLIGREERSDIQAYIRTGLFTLVSINVRRGNRSAAKAILDDPRLHHGNRRYLAWTFMVLLPTGASQILFHFLSAARNKRRSALKQQSRPRLKTTPYN